MDAVLSSSEYQNYLELEKKLKENTTVSEYISEIKDLQKKMVRLEFEGKNTAEINQKYQEKLALLNEIPLYVAFVEKQETVNDIFQTIKFRIEKFLDELVRNS